MSSDWGGEPVSLGVVRKPVAHPHSAVEPPDALTCPISLELFSDPVQVPCCGNTLDRRSLRPALPRCPLCRVNIKDKFPSFGVDDVPTNRAVASLVDEHLAQTPRIAANVSIDLTDPAAAPLADDPATKLDDRACGLCMAPAARFRCAGCKCTYYCSAKCQKEAWPEHKADCKAAAVAKAKSEQAALKKKLTQAQIAANGDGLACTRDPAFRRAGPPIAADALAKRRTDLLAAMVDLVNQGRLVVLSDAPEYNRLLVASRRAPGGVYASYQEHVVEAGMDAGLVGRSDGHCCWWTMMDFKAGEMREQGLAPIDVATLQAQFATALEFFADCREDGAPSYRTRADPTVMDGHDDADMLIEQMLAESPLRFLLAPQVTGRVEGKKRTPDPKEVRKALEALQGGVSLQKGRP